MYGVSAVAVRGRVLVCLQRRKRTAVAVRLILYFDLDFDWDRPSTAFYGNDQSKRDNVVFRVLEG